MRRCSSILTLVFTLFLSVTLAFTGAVKDQPGSRKTKLAAPQNVTCTVGTGEVSVAWDAVPDAATYQVEYTGTLIDGVIDKESDYVAAAPYVITTEEYAALMVHVRALPAPKKDGKPQSGSAQRRVV